MDKKIAGLLGAAAALTTMSAAQSALAKALQNAPPTSYRGLLEPVPDALNALKADDARIAAAKTQGGERLAQYYYHHHHHHHHHQYGNGCPPGYTVQGGNCAPYRGH
jgi:DNA-binding PucR family transcriptional regulator